jgi:drug/metabolite transporter (DMT)-like permease
MKSDNTFAKWGILILLSITWGSSFILMELALPHFSALEVGSLRMLFAGIALSPFLIKSLKVIQRHHWKYLILFGLLGNTLPAILFATAQQHITSSMAGILNSTVPFFTLIVGLTFYKQTTKWWNVLGIIIGFIGTLLIIKFNNPEGMQLSSSIKYTSLVILATFFYAINVNMLKFNLPDLKSKEITSVGFALMFIPLVLFMLWQTDFYTNIQDAETQKALIYPIVLGVVGSGGAVLIFNQLIKISSPLFASSVTYLIPIVALILGILYGESFPLINLPWVAMVLVGVYLVNKKEKVTSK